MNVKMTLTQKISMAAMLLAISFVLTIVSKTINMGNFFFVRFSFAPGIVVGASLLLGPFFGGLIGVLTDLLPALVYPTGAFNVFITLVYLLLGVCPYYLLKLLKGAPDWLLMALPIFVLIILEGVLAFLFYGTTLLDASFGEAAEWAKVLILVACFTVFPLLEILLIILSKRMKLTLSSSVSTSEMVCISCICELVIMVVLKALAFFLFYEFLAGGENAFSFSFIFSMLLVGAIPDVILMSFTSSFLIWLSEKIMKAGSR